MRNFNDDEVLRIMKSSEILQDVYRREPNYTLWIGGIVVIVLTVITVGTMII